MARPDYRPEYAEQARKLCATFGAADWEIAQFLSTDEVRVRAKDVRRWHMEHPEFQAACKAGDALVTDRVVRALVKLASGYRYKAVKILPPPKGYTEPIYAPYTEVVAPRMDAIKFWLINRGGGQWADEKSVSVTVNDERAENLTDDKLAAIAASDAAQPDHAG